MSDAITDALDIEFPDGLPEWVAPFAAAVGKMEEIEKRGIKRKKRLQQVRSEGAVGEERDMTEAERSAEKELLAEVEVAFETAITQSKGTHPLPYTWLAVLHTHLEAWPKAREAAQKAVDLQPTSTTALFRLSTCCEQERDYPNAHKYFHQAYNLLPYSVRMPYYAKLARLKEQAAARDPIALPLELSIHIMKYRLAEDVYAVLRCSWISKRWRSTLNDQCPELWSTFPVTAKDLKDKQGEKRAAWIRRSGGRFKEVILAGLNLTSVNAIPKSYYDLFKPVESLAVTVKAPNVIPRLVEKHQIGDRFPALKHLTIRGGMNPNGRGAGFTVPARQAVDCGLVGEAARQTLESMTVLETYYNGGSSFTAPNAPPVPETIHLFPKLNKLRFSYCAMKYHYRYPGRGRAIPEEQREYQKDPLHDLLRGAENLESLEALPYTSNYSDIIDVSGPRPQIFKRVDLPHLKTALIPPPRVWTVDIMAPQLESLMYRMPPQSGISHRKPLIPELEDAPVPSERLSQLKSVELACNRNDNISRLETWLRRLDNVTKLSIRNAPADEKYPDRDLWDMDGNHLDDIRAGIHISQFLSDHPELCPKLEELHLDCCYTNGKSMVDYVRKRKALEGCASIQRLELLNGTALSKKAEAALKAEVPHLRVVSRWDYDAKHHQNDNFEFDMPEDRAAYSWFIDYYSL